ncbi:CASP C terminal-domain-containing protein [Spinellus fusiger]|nr:CASP C terminal-domain-containing protein [Spinellus fusiger]
MTNNDKDHFSIAIQFWKGIHLSELQKDLDQQGTALVENQKDGLVSRKKLAEQTREFKKIPDEEKLSQIKTLLKGYQSEIDNVTRRTKYAENAFFNLYKLFVEAPDPVPLLEAAISETANTIEEQLAQDTQTLQMQLEEAQEQLKRLQTVEKATAERQKQTALEEVNEASCGEKKKDALQKEQQLRQQYADKIKSYKEREHDLQYQLNQALDQLVQLQHTHDDTQAQLIGHNQKYDEEIVGKLAELDIVTMDLERANARVLELERITEEQKSNTNMAIGANSPASVETQQDAQVNRLMKDVNTYKDLLQKAEIKSSSRIKELTKESSCLVKEKERLAKKLKEFDDYHEIKRELEIIKYVEFSNEDIFDAKDVLHQENLLQKSLEVQLMEKTKRLESEHTQMKMAFADTKKELEASTIQCEALELKTSEQTQLIEKLEQDLSHLGPNTHSSGLESFSRTNSSLHLNHSALSLSSMDVAPRTIHESVTGIIPIGKDDKSILPIVMNQRDRFKQRNEEMEEQTRHLETKLSEMKNQVEHLEADNLKLYERLRFVHVWKDEQSKGLVRHFKKRDSASEDPTDRYGKLYEESMNPFMQFHRKEETRRYHAMNVAEKLSYNVTRVLFSHKWSRYFLIVYALMLHLLVVVTLYQLSLWECRHDHDTLHLHTAQQEALEAMGGV